MTRCAVIILNWNGAALLRRFLPDVIANTDSALAEIIVADNGSTDDSLEVLAREFPQVRVIAFDRNYGFAEGYNRAIAAVDAPLVVLLNSDVAPRRGWIEPLVRCMEDADVAACQPKILSVERPDEFEYAGACGGFIDRNGYPYCRGRIFDTVERDTGRYDSDIDVDWASGAALMVRRQAYLQAGGLDASFFAHMEEIDLCWRLRLMGYRIRVVTESAVYHLGGGSLPASSVRKTYLNFRNNLLMLRRNLPRRGRRWLLIKRRLLDTIALLKYLVTKPAHAVAIYRAHRDYRRMAPNLAAAPGDETARMAQRLAMRRRPNILTQYYLRRRRTYDRFR